jgi:hypothetical protein
MKRLRLRTSWDCRLPHAETIGKTIGQRVRLGAKALWYRASACQSR